jgi:5-formyltetrahydrofolate cyclo-ligase
MSDEQEPRTHHPSPITHHSVDLAHLRSSMRQRRRSLSLAVRSKAAYAVAARMKSMPLLRKGRRIAVYKAIDGEIDLAPLIRYAQRVGCALYAPHIVDMRARRMEFVRLSWPVGMASTSVTRIDPRLLDVVFVPLVAFDVRGWRLGFGAGFYDRKFAFARRSFRHRPLLIGIGYEFQRTAPQKPQPWDVPLHAVVTERHIYRCRTHQTAIAAAPL